MELFINVDSNYSSRRSVEARIVTYSELPDSFKKREVSEFVKENPELFTFEALKVRVAAGKYVFVGSESYMFDSSPLAVWNENRNVLVRHYDYCRETWVKVEEWVAAQLGITFPDVG